MLVSAFVAGVLTSTSPCVLAAVPITVGFVGSRARDRGEAALLSLSFVAGMTLAFAALGLMAARLGLFFGSLGGAWMAFVGALVTLAGLWLLTAPADRCSGLALPASLQARFKGSGMIGAVVLGALTGTIMTPCATPALAAALSLAGAGGLLGHSSLMGAVMLLAYGLGHSVLLLGAGIAPTSIQTVLDHLGLGGAGVVRVILAGLLVVSGLWIIWIGLNGGTIGP